MSASDPIRAWQSQDSQTTVPKPEEVRMHADQFYRRVRRRNLIEYIACIFVVAIFSAYVVMLPVLAARVGAAMIVIGTLFVAWQLHRRASATPPPEAAGEVPLLIHQREQLARQRDALSSIAIWYLGPFAPGLLVMMFAPAFELGPQILLEMPAGVAATMLAIVAVFGGIWWLNRLVARKLGKAVDEIDALLGEGR